MSAITPAHSNAWPGLVELSRRLQPAPQPGEWLTRLLERSQHCDYLRQFGSPATIEEFRQRVPVCRYDDIKDWIDRSLLPCAHDVLFAGAAVGCERTGGSSRGPKLIPYSIEGLSDFQYALLPWLADVVQRYQISGSIYLATSPATRAPEVVGHLPLGLPDGAYLGPEAGALLQQHQAVPLTVNQLTNVAEWRAQTLAHLRSAHELELISVWSPTFFLELLRDIPDAAARWPRLKLISCWASAGAAPYAAELARLLPHAHLQPKGLLATEGVVTVPDADDKPVLTRHGFFEFAAGNALYLPHELQTGGYYRVILTSASGLYRYDTGDRVQCIGATLSGDMRLTFVGRDGLTSDLVGEKLTEAFVRSCWSDLPGFHLLIPHPHPPGYRWVSDQPIDDAQCRALDARLCANPQYAHARQLGQLHPVQALHCPDAAARYTHTLLMRGTRLADIKPLALRAEHDWTATFEAISPTSHCS